MLTHGISLAREAAEYFNASLLGSGVMVMSLLLFLAASICPSTAGRR